MSSPPENSYEFPGLEPIWRSQKIIPHHRPHLSINKNFRILALKNHEVAGGRRGVSDVGTIKHLDKMDSPDRTSRKLDERTKGILLHLPIVNIPIIFKITNTVEPGYIKH